MNNCISFQWCVLWIIVFSIAAVIITVLFVNWKKSWKEKDEKHKKRRTEEERVRNLPKIDYKYLLKIEDEHLKMRLRAPRDMEPCTFKIRKNFIVVVDRNMNVLVGLLHPDLIISLKKAEYKKDNFLWIPLKGEGEKYQSESVEIEGMTIKVMPIWFRTDKTDTHEWETWIAMKKSYDDYFEKNPDYQEIFNLIWFGVRKTKEEEMTELLKRVS